MEWCSNHVSWLCILASGLSDTKRPRLHCLIIQYVIHRDDLYYFFVIFLVPSTYAILPSTSHHSPSCSQQKPGRLSWFASWTRANDRQVRGDHGWPFKATASRSADRGGVEGEDGLKQWLAAIFWVVPLPSKSHHQDYYIFSRGSL